MTKPRESARRRLARGFNPSSENVMAVPLNDCVSSPAAIKRAQRYVASESHHGHHFNGELCDACVADARELLGALGLLP
jgi:hypothetical protein